MLAVWEETVIDVFTPLYTLTPSIYITHMGAIYIHCCIQAIDSAAAAPPESTKDPNNTNTRGVYNITQARINL